MRPRSNQHLRHSVLQCGYGSLNFGLHSPGRYAGRDQVERLRNRESREGLALRITNPLDIGEENQPIRAISLRAGNGHLVAIYIEYTAMFVASHTRYYRQVALLDQQFHEPAVGRHRLAYVPQRGIELNGIHQSAA